MKTSIKTLLAVVAMGATAIAAHAAGAVATPRVVTVDLGKALNGYWRTAEETARLQGFEQQANKQAESILAEGRAMAEKIQQAQATIQSPVATDLAKQQAQADGQRLLADIQNKERQLNEFRQQAVQQIQQNVMQTRQALLIEIANKATDIGKAKGANMIVERNAFVFADAGMDITDEVLAQLNAGHPMPAPAPAAPATQPPVGFPAR